MSNARGSVIFAGGGTGGHIFPALAIAEAMGELPDGDAIRRIAIGADKPLDTELLGAASASGEIDGFRTIPARPFGLHPRAMASLARSWGACVRETRMLIRDERERTGRDPVVVAMGGYVAAPPVRAALSERCRVVLVNLDAVPGKANRWIARRADERYSVGRETALFEPLESVAVNPIVRRQIVDVPTRSEARRLLDLDPERPTLLVTGGSLGARTVNVFMAEFVGAHGGVMRDGGWQVLHLCGNEDGAALAATYGASAVLGVVAPRTATMGLAWAAADAAVCRAGAGTVAEVWATRTPALFLPYPFHRDEHQRVNAGVLTEIGGGLLGVDRVGGPQNLSTNGPMLLEMLTDPARRATMVDMLEGLGPADGAQRVARSVAALLG